MLSKGILLGSDQVPGPHLGRLESHLPRDSVEYELERGSKPGARDSTIGKDRHLFVAADQVRHR